MYVAVSPTGAISLHKVLWKMNNFKSRGGSIQDEPGPSCYTRKHGAIEDH